MKYLKQNSESTTKLSKEQYVVKFSVGSIKNTLSYMDYNEAKMKEGLLQVKDCLAKVV
jgi:hypothetical protein